MPLNVNAGGSWRTASKVYAKVAGAWVTAKEMWGYMNGGWRSAWKNEIRYINTANRTGASIFEMMGSPTQPNIYVFENQATISAGTGSYALRTGVFPSGSILKIVNKGYIRGRGGDGGSYNSAGGAGGNALVIDYNCELHNGAGYILGGGGGGGGAQSVNPSDGRFYARAAGGGGAGMNAGARGAGTAYSDSTSGGQAYLLQSREAAAGSAEAGGVGALRVGGSQVGSGNVRTSVEGGLGGGPGTAGLSGSASVSGKSWNPYSFAGGAAGAAIIKNGKTLTITAGNDTNRIRGAII